MRVYERATAHMPPTNGLNGIPLAINILEQ